MKWKRHLILSIVALMFASGCANDVDRLIEEAQFALDDGNFTEAEAKAREALTLDSTNNEAKFYLATSLASGAVLGNNSTFLSLLSNLQSEKTPGESNTETFVRIAPELTAAQLADLEEATDQLSGISLADRTSNPDFSLLLYMTRLFEIASAVSAIGATNPDNECNANPANPNTDGIPDGYDPDALSGDRATRFDNNLENVDGDGERAGLGSGFEVSERVNEMNSALEDAISNQAGDIAAGLEEFFTDEFGDPSNEALCTL